MLLSTGFKVNLYIEVKPGPVSKLGHQTHHHLYSFKFIIITEFFFSDLTIINHHGQACKMQGTLYPMCLFGIIFWPVFCSQTPTALSRSASAHAIPAATLRGYSTVLTLFQMLLTETHTFGKVKVSKKNRNIEYHRLSQEAQI